MKDNTPVNDPTQSSEDVLGENQKLLILHKAFNELTEDESEKDRREKMR